MVKKKNKNYLRLVSSVMLLGVIVLSVLILGVRLLGYQTFPVIDDDMAPTYRLGSLAYVKKVEEKEITQGTIISYRSGQGASTSMQRVGEVLDGGNSFRTLVDKESSIETKDIPLADVIGSPAFSIPFLGYFAVLIANKVGFLVSVLFIISLAFVNNWNYFLKEFKKRYHR